MFSTQSLSYLNKKDRYKIELFLKKPNLQKLIKLLKTGAIPRPQYGLGILMACNQALNLNIKEISVIEIGYYDNSSIVDLVEYKRIIEKVFPIKLHISYYNISIKLLNESKNIYDRKDFFKSLKKNEKIRKIKKVEIFDFKNLSKQKFINKPLGFIIFDTRNYSITNKALKVFKKSILNYLPKTILYFDHLYKSSHFEGEFLSIKEFNKKNNKKISDILEFPEQLSLFWNKWLFLGKRLKYFINFKHPKFQHHIDQII